MFSQPNNPLNDGQTYTIDTFCGIVNEYNNHQDCDTLYELVNKLKQAKTQGEALKAVDAIISIMNYYKSDLVIFLEAYKKDLIAMESLMMAIKYNNKIAQDYFNRAATCGLTMRLC